MKNVRLYTTSHRTYIENENTFFPAIPTPAVANRFRIWFDCVDIAIYPDALAPLPIQCDTFLQFYVDESLTQYDICTRIYAWVFYTTDSTTVMCECVCSCLCVLKGMYGKEIVNAVCLCVPQSHVRNGVMKYICIFAVHQLIRRLFQANQSWIDDNSTECRTKWRHNYYEFSY